MRHAILVAILVATIPVVCSAQTPSAADGPWFGQVQCVLSARGADYQDDQTHTWRLTGGQPQLVGTFRRWPAMWSVQGSGSGPAGTWKTTVPATSAPIAVWEPAAGRIRFGSQHGLLNVNGGITGTASTRAAINAPFQEWEFPVVEDDAKLTTISGTRTRMVPGRAWRQPPDVLTTETCTWNYTKDLARATQISSATGTTVAAPTLRAAGPVGAGTIQPAPTPPPTDTFRRDGESTAGSRAILNTTPAPARSTDLSVRIAPEFTSGVGQFSTPAADWHVTFVNAGPDDANGALVSAGDGSGAPGLDPSRSSASCFATSGASCPASVNVQQLAQGIAIPRWPIGGEVHFLVRTDVISKAGGQAILDASAAAAAGAADPSSSNNFVEATYGVTASSVRPRADLAVTVSLPLFTIPGQNDRGSYAVTVTNRGPDSANGAQVVVPPGLTKYTVNCMSTNGAICPSGTTIAQIESGVVIPFWPTGGTVQFSGIMAVAPSGLTQTLTASLSAVARTTASVDDPQPDNNNAKASTIVRISP